MKELSYTLLALAFVCFSLISLISVNQTWDNASAPLSAGESHLSDLGLRFNMNR